MTSRAVYTLGGSNGTQVISVDHSFFRALQDAAYGVTVSLAEKIAREEGIPPGILLGVIAKTTRDIMVRFGNGETMVSRMDSWSAEECCWARVLHDEDPMIYVPCDRKTSGGSKYCGLHSTPEKRANYGDISKPLPNNERNRKILMRYSVLTEVLLWDDDTEKFKSYRPRTGEIVDEFGRVTGFVREDDVE